MKTKIIPSEVVCFVTLVAMIVVVSLSANAQVRPQKAESVDWLLGEWVGTRKSPFCEWDATIRITAYDQATQAFTGDGYLEVKGETCGQNPAHTDLVIKVVIDDEGRLVMTWHHSRGSNTFNLKRERDGRLAGTETHGGSGRLTLEKQQ